MEKNLRPHILLRLAKNGSNFKSAFGPGTAELLRGIQSSGSLNTSAKNMHMAYSKAWRVLRETEDHLGVQLIERRGARGSTLTAEALTLLKLFEEMETAANAAAEKVLQEFSW